MYRYTWLKQTRFGQHKQQSAFLKWSINEVEATDKLLFIIETKYKSKMTKDGKSFVSQHCHSITDDLIG